MPPISTRRADTLPHRMREVLLSSSPLARLPLRRTTSRGGLSRSVLRLPARFRLPTGTVYCLVQNIESCVVISIKHESTARTNMCPDRKTFLDTCTTSATILRRESRFNRNHRNGMPHPIVLDPHQEAPPGGITDTLGEPPVLHEIAYLKVFIGNQIAR